VLGVGSRSGEVVGDGARPGRRSRERGWSAWAWAWAPPPTACSCSLTGRWDLTGPETEALTAAPDRGTWHGRRDHALLLTAVHTGLRVSELTGLTIADTRLGDGPHLRCHGKGRKERCTPLTPEAAKILRAWTRERGGQPEDPLFPSRRGTRLSRDSPL